MKTEVFMQRNLDGIIVRQSNQTEMYNATDLVEGYESIRKDLGLPQRELHKYWQMESTKEFISALEKQTAKSGGLLKKVCRGKDNKGTWVHPAIFVDIAMWLNPEFKAKVMIWLADNLLKVRGESAESYKVMTQALLKRFSDKAMPHIMFINISNTIKEKVLGDINGCWECASEEQLRQRDRLHYEVASGCKFLPKTLGYKELRDTVLEVNHG